MQVAGEGGCLTRHTFHHVAIAAERVNVVVEQREVRPIELARQPAAADRHADAVTAALAERAGGGFDAWACDHIPGGRDNGCRVAEIA